MATRLLRIQFAALQPQTRSVTQIGMKIFSPDAGPSTSRRAQRSCLRIALRLCMVLLLAGGANAQTLQDFFASRQTATSASGRVDQSNANATFEVGEPKHGGKTGGHSLWISWVAPTNGVVEFETEASGFDTLLSAYEFTTTNGTTFAELREVARADDSEGFGRESEIEFGVLAGRRYEIAVDGYFGATGFVELKWDFEPLPEPPPIILSSPADRSVGVGDPVSLVITLTNAASGEFKWYFNGNELNVTTTNLNIPSFQSTNVGRYKLRVSADGLQYFSVPTEIQINTDGATNTLAQSKLLDAPETPLVGGAPAPAPLAAEGKVTAQGGGGPISGVVRGYNGSQIFNTSYATADPVEPAHCGVAGGSSYWLIYQPPTNGTLTLDTLGSTYDTVLETYTYNGTLSGFQDLISLACANDSFGSNGPSRVQLPVVQSRQYIVAVDGVNAAFGTAWLNYKLNTNALPQPPTLVSTPQSRTVVAGSTAILTAPVTGSVPLAFAWRKDNVLMPNMTAPSLTLTNVTNTNSGNYTFTATNDIGSVNGTFAFKVVTPPSCVLARIPGGVQLSFATLEGQTYTVEQSTNLLAGWVAWPGSFVGNGLTNYFNLSNSGTKFYRVRVE